MIDENLWNLFISEGVKQSPSLIALIFIVRWFISHLSKVEATRDKLIDEQSKLWAATNDKSDAVLREVMARLKSVMDEVSKVLERNAEVVGRSIHTVTRIETLGQAINTALARLDHAIKAIEFIESIGRVRMANAGHSVSIEAVHGKEGG